MKKLFTLTLLTAFLMVAGMGQTTSYDVWFTWDKNPAIEMVSGYRIEYQKAPVVTNWTYLITVPGYTNVAVIKGLQGGYIYKFRSFAVNAIGTGTDTSNVVLLPNVLPTAVTNFSTTTPK